MIDDSERRLTQVASLVNAIGRGENASANAVLNWLLQRSDGGVKLPVLWMLGRTPAEGAYRASADESVRAWRNLADRAQRQRLDEYSMPTAASSWFVHAGDLLTLLDQDFGWTEAVRTEIKALAARHLPPGGPQATSIGKSVVQGSGSSPAGPNDPPAADLGRKVKLVVLVKEHEALWPTMSLDLKHAAKNGLRDAAAVAGERGYWWEQRAVDWAKARGKYSRAANGATLQSVWAGGRVARPLGDWPDSADE